MLYTLVVVPDGDSEIIHIYFNCISVFKGQISIKGWVHMHFVHACLHRCTIEPCPLWKLGNTVLRHNDVIGIHNGLSSIWNCHHCVRGKIVMRWWIWKFECAYTVFTWPQGLLAGCWSCLNGHPWILKLTRVRLNLRWWSAQEPTAS